MKSLLYSLLAYKSICRKYTTLFYTKNQTEVFCIKEINRWPALIEFVQNQTEELCLLAVKMDETSLKHIRNQTEKICVAALNNCINYEKQIYCLDFIKNDFWHEHFRLQIILDLRKPDNSIKSRL